MMRHDQVTPYETADPKKKQVAEMFDNISGSYDFLNHFFSAGIDKRWRKKAIDLLREDQPEEILDVATGTGDFAFEALRLNPRKVIGIDISDGMLEIGREKIRRRKMDDRMEFIHGDSENLPFEEDRFDAITVAFGVRNFQDLKAGLSEMKRVLKPGGKAVILEFSKPKKFPLKQLYFGYFKYIMPLLGKVVSKDKSAYEYLPRSVVAFPEGKHFQMIMHEVGFSRTECKKLTGGIASIYTGWK
jgi:demethylmenaquinone methyltransferase/2-methoxy-6-polyprenyl-1,4-benzoquinol methylase